MRLLFIELYAVFFYISLSAIIMTASALSFFKKALKVIDYSSIIKRL
ncbi:MAG TPA: hypothetical protein PLM75_09325 [bacterium]|nr:hypothetical protein [bacterium]